MMVRTVGLLSLFKRKKHISPEDQAVIDGFSKAVDAMLSAPPQKSLTKKEYEEIRQAERDWLEAHYDFSTLESIQAIPERLDLPHPPGKTSTGEIYYYLRYKARLYEQEGKIELALACMRKSITLMQLKYGTTSGKEECYSYVRMLARNGYSSDARAAKSKFDLYYSDGLDSMRLQNFQAVCRQAKSLGTDFLIMSVCGSTCPECAKYQGRVYSISGNSKIFPPLPDFIKKTGVVHPGCHHSFSPYIHKVTHVNMNYTLQVHPLKKTRYKKNIVTFSNRPFEDDRTDECKKKAELARQNRMIQKENKIRYEENMIRLEEEKRRDYMNYEWLKAHFPDKCPASPSGYRRMKTQNTKNYQVLKQLAAKLGKEI